MATSLSALPTGLALLPRNIVSPLLVLILLEAEWAPGPSPAGLATFADDTAVLTTDSDLAIASH
jgi:hypothetical protein